MHRRFRVLAIGTALCAGPMLHAAGPPPSATSTSESARVVRAVETMYVAATNDDLTLFRTVAASDFFSFDGGKRYDGAELMQMIRSAHAAGKVYIWQVTEPRVELFGDAALMTYVNRGSLSDASGKQELTWLESAVLVKTGGEWRIRFFHSTRVP